MRSRFRFKWTIQLNANFWRYLSAKGHDFKHKKHNIFRDVICFLLFSLQKLIITLWSLGHRLHLALHKGLKIGNYLITSTTKVANLKLLTRENKGDHLEGHHWAEKEYTHAWKKWNRQIWDERPWITWLLWMRKSKF